VTVFRVFEATLLAEHSTVAETAIMARETRGKKTIVSTRPARFGREFVRHAECSAPPTM